MRPVDAIRRKRDGHQLASAEIADIVRGVTDGAWSDPQVAAWLMAVVWRGMSDEETVALTTAMAQSGAVLDLGDLPGPTVDKHSTGGVGDKTSLLLAPIVAAAGALVPMMSGRGLGHTGGTLDKLESIPNLRTTFAVDDFKAIVASVGCAIVGQTDEIAPADRRLYALRDVTDTVESIPLITASILSKKIAEGTAALVLDVKVGSGAFMKDEEAALALGRALLAVGRAAGVRTEAIVTDMDAPLGRTVGNALEVREAIHALAGRSPDDLRALTLTLASLMLVAAGVATDHADGERRASEALDSGQALERFRRMVEAQGGDPRVVDDVGRLPAAEKTVVTAASAGYIATIDAELVGRAAVVLGAGRTQVDDSVDPAVGIVVLVRRGEEVAPGTPMFEVHYRNADTLAAGRPLLAEAVTLADAPPGVPSLVRGRVSIPGGRLVDV